MNEVVVATDESEVILCFGGELVVLVRAGELAPADFVEELLAQKELELPRRGGETRTAEIIDILCIGPIEILRAFGETENEAIGSENLRSIKNNLPRFVANAIEIDQRDAIERDILASSARKLDKVVVLGGNIVFVAGVDGRDSERLSGFRHWGRLRDWLGISNICRHECGEDEGGNDGNNVFHMGIL